VESTLSMEFFTGFTVCHPVRLTEVSNYQA
jgi:hypothetical protein